ncbi:DUF742 domain-containing protein [Actinomadura sp. 9N407]|uniref:DUF742 domain-containing protein n=1 Tax=Actinomadura sp. 9N407 TaxID=3375154 RepID=UPI0037B05AA1
MNDPHGKARQDWAEGGPERLYVVTGSGYRPAEQIPLDLVTLIVTRHGPEPGTPPESAAILHMCANPLSVAEISAHLSLPASTVSLLVTDLMATGRVEARAPMRAAPRPDAALLEAVIHGLSRI